MPISPARAAAFDILLRVEQTNAYASELLHSERLEKLAMPIALSQPNSSWAFCAGARGWMKRSQRHRRGR